MIPITRVLTEEGEIKENSNRVIFCIKQFNILRLLRPLDMFNVVEEDPHQWVKTLSR